MVAFSSESNLVVCTALSSLLASSDYLCSLGRQTCFISGEDIERIEHLRQSFRSLGENPLSRPSCSYQTRLRLYHAALAKINL